MKKINAENKQEVNPTKKEWTTPGIVEVLNFYDTEQATYPLTTKDEESFGVISK